MVTIHGLAFKSDHQPCNSRDQLDSQKQRNVGSMKIGAPEFAPDGILRFRSANNLTSNHGRAIINRTNVRTFTPPRSLRLVREITYANACRVKKPTEETFGESSVEKSEFADSSQRQIPLSFILLVAVAIHAPLLLMKLPLKSYDTNCPSGASRNWVPPRLFSSGIILSIWPFLSAKA